MNVWKSLPVAALVAALAAPVAAQGLSFGEIDRDGDARLARAELDAAFGAEAASRMLVLRDTNGDGVLTRAEGNRSARIENRLIHAGAGYAWDDVDNGDH